MLVKNLRISQQHLHPDFAKQINNRFISNSKVIRIANYRNVINLLNYQIIETNRVFIAAILIEENKLLVIAIEKNIGDAIAASEAYLKEMEIIKQGAFLEA